MSVLFLLVAESGADCGVVVGLCLDGEQIRSLCCLEQHRFAFHTESQGLPWDM